MLEKQHGMDERTDTRGESQVNDFFLHPLLNG
jgi:hypothetical protein